MKPFNLEEAKAGKPVCTKDGRNVRIICFDRHCENLPIIGLVENDDGSETCLFYANNGRFYTNSKSSLDLMMKSTKKEEKQLIEKACEWLIRGGYFVNSTETIEDFKKAMGFSD